MNYTTLGKTGLVVSELCLGGMTLGNFHSMGLPVAGEEEGVAILNEFEKHGGNFIDTANIIYGDSEEVIGRWLENRSREKVVIATKVGFGGTAPNECGHGRKHIKAQVEESLKRLKTDYIDLYQLHFHDVKTPLEETFRTLDELVRSGKVHYIGVSNYRPSTLQKAIDLCKYTGIAPVSCIQPQYSLLCRAPEWDLLKVCEEEGVGVIPWSPLAGGWLTGRYKRNTQTDEGGRAAWAESKGFKALSMSDNPLTWQVLDEVEKIAKETGHTMSQVSVRWCLQKTAITAPIVGARTLSQIQDSLGSVGWSLSAEQMARLDAASEVDVPYPYVSVADMIKKKK